MLRRIPWAPEVATPRVMARVAGALYTAGGAAVMVAALQVGPRLLVLLGLGAMLSGPPVMVWGRSLPRWAFHGLVATGTALITTGTIVADGPVTAVAVASLGTFAALDAFFFFSWPGAVAQLALITVGTTLGLSLHPDVPAGTVVILDVVVLSIAFATGGLVGRAVGASQDALTGLANRRGFDEAMEELLRGAARSGEPMSAALLDLDHFKAINDAAGHAAGDELLRAVAARWRPALPPGAVLARHGGDEFSLLLPDHAGPVALAVVEQLRQSCPDVGLSCGVTELQPGDTAAQLMRRADRALYQAKAAGRGRSVLEDPGADPLVAALWAALSPDREDSGLQVHYQPIVAVADGSIVGVEALARWSHPQLGPVPPGRFVPMAEEHGIIGALGGWVLRRACTDLADLHTTSGRPLLLTVNVSGQQLCDPAFPAVVAAALADTGWPAASTVLEVTENLLAAESPTAVSALTGFRAAGLSVAIDDFGTGYSSLARLDTLPADFLKLDDTFVAALTTSDRRAGLMRSIMALSDALGLSLIAEGVETAEQAALLRDLGCRYAQGFHYHRPMPVADLPAALTSTTAWSGALPTSSR